MSRYARQIAVPGIGEAGQRRIASVCVEVAGVDLAAEVCALYLAGAGVKRLLVGAALLDRIRAANEEVEVAPLCSPGSKLEVRVVAPIEAAHVEEGEDPVLAGARAARWVLAKSLGVAP